jgi:transposase
MTRLTRDQKQKQARRIKAVRALQRGLPNARVAAMFETSCASVSNWAMRFRVGGIEGLSARPVGRPSRLEKAPACLAAVRDQVTGCYPDSLGLPGALWSWRNVQALIFRTCKKEMSRWTVARHLRDWGFHPLEHSGLSTEVSSSEIPAGRPIGRTVCELACNELVMPNLELRTVLSSLGQRGEMAFAVYPSPLASANLIEFLERLRRHIGMPLIVRGPDSLVRNLEIHGWRARHGKEILFEAVTKEPIRPRTQRRA